MLWRCADRIISDRDRLAERLKQTVDATALVVVDRSLESKLQGGAGAASAVRDRERDREQQPERDKDRDNKERGRPESADRRVGAGTSFPLIKVCTLVSVKSGLLTGSACRAAVSA